MTIKGLWDTIKEKCKEGRVSIPRKSFSGLRVAIDAMSLLFRLRLRARGSLVNRIDIVNIEIDESVVDHIWLRLITEEIVEFLLSGITPVLIFEVGIPRLKVKKREQRDSERLSDIDQIRLLRAEIQSMDPLRVDKEKLKLLKSKEASLKSLPRESRMKAYDYLYSIGVPCVMPKSGMEAERMAAMLCRSGVVAAVYTSDGDCLAHKCPITIREATVTSNYYDENFNEVRTYEVILFNKVIESLELDENSFTELCIMSGCDYNDNIEQIGIGRALKLIQKYKNIDNIPIDVLYTTSLKRFKSLDVLDHIECRKEFCVIEPWDLLDEDFLLQQDIEASSIQELVDMKFFDMKPYSEFITEGFNMYDMMTYIDQWVLCIEGFPQCSSFKHSTEREEMTLFGPITITEGDSLDNIREFIEPPPKTKRNYTKKNNYSTKKK